MHAHKAKISRENIKLLAAKIPKGLLPNYQKITLVGCLCLFRLNS